jgi:hypothetical protein
MPARGRLERERGQTMPARGRLERERGRQPIVARRRCLLALPCLELTFYSSMICQVFSSPYGSVLVDIDWFDVEHAEEIESSLLATIDRRTQRAPTVRV